MAARITHAELARLRPPAASPARHLLPWPPSANLIWRSVLVGKSPRVLLSARGRAYRREVAAALALAGAARWAGPVGVHLDAYPPDRRRRDIDNLMKAILDACTHGGLWGDDAQVSHLSVTRRPPCRPGRVELTVTPWGGEVLP